MKHVAMSQSATSATRKRGCATFEPPKATAFAALPHRHGHSDLTQTVVNGCERLRRVANGGATSSEHTLNPQIPRVKREPLLRIRENYLTVFNLTIFMMMF